MLFLRDIALARNSANLRICPLRSLFAMLLRDVVWLGIASKLSLLSLYTTLLRDVVLARHSEQALSALTLYNVEEYFIPFWIYLSSILGAKAEWKHLVCRQFIVLCPKSPKLGRHF